MSSEPMKKEKSDNMITIFTPTYNRAYRLPTLYRSLQRQTCMDFEWIIVDDGSSDNTEDLVAGWIAQKNPFAIRYFPKVNGGKHTAINLGVEKADYEWFFIVDSDDYVADDAVERIHEWIATVKDDSIAAVSGTRCFPEGNRIGECRVLPGTFIDARNNERKRYHLLGDKSEVYKTEILKKYPFPVFPGETFLAEGAVWDKIALDGYKIRWFDYPTVICEYLADGLTTQLNGTSIEVRNFEGCTYYTQVMLQSHSGMEKLRILCQYINKARKKGLTYPEMAHRINRSPAEMMLLSVPVHLKNWLKNRK